MDDIYQEIVKVRTEGEEAALDASPVEVGESVSVGCSSASP